MPEQVITPFMEKGERPLVIFVVDSNYLYNFSIANQKKSPQCGIYVLKPKEL
jgi:hypothetical protein